MSEKFEKNPELKGPEKLDGPKDSAITEKGDQDLAKNLDQKKTDSAETPSMGYEAETGLKASKLMMVDSADSASMQEMEAVNDPKIQQELAMRRSIREKMEVGPGRDEAEKIAKEVFRAKEVVEPTEHKVVKGDNLWRIARRHLGKSASDREVKEHVEQIVKLNGIKNPDLIYPGEQFKLPGFTINGEESGKGGEPGGDGPPGQPSDNSLTGREKASELMERYEKEDISKDSTLGQEKEKLLKLVGDDPQTKEWFKEHMDEFEQRQQKNPDVVSKEEVRETYAQISRLLSDKTSTLLKPEEREALSQQIMLQAAMPQTISQGQHSTCSVAAVEVRTYSRDPSQAARLVTDVALNGRYHATRGPEVEIDPKTVDPESINSADDSANRTHASEIFERTAVNLKLTQKNATNGGNLKYEQHKPGQGSESGEGLYDYSHLNNKGQPTFIADYPSLTDSDVVDISSFISGLDETGSFIVSESMDIGDKSKITVFSSEQDFVNKLIELRNQKRFPLIFKVFTGTEPFYSDSNYDKLGGVGGSHIITINKIIDGPPPAALIDNQWNEDKDHLTPEKAISLHDLYVASLFPEDSIAHVQDDIEIKRNNGTSTNTDELDFIRMKILANRLHDTRPQERELQEFMNQMEKMNLPPEQYDKIKNRSFAAVFSLKFDGIMRMREFWHNKGEISAKDYDKELIQYGVTSNTTKSKLGVDHKSVYEDLVAHLPKNRRQYVLGQVSQRLAKARKK